MNIDQEKNEAVAIACGYTLRREQGCVILQKDGHNTGSWHYHDDVAWLEGCPNYGSDLNAMHEAEKAVPRVSWCDYARYLRAIVQRDCNTLEHYELGCERSQLISDFWFYHATASQRRDALLKTLGLWKAEWDLK